MPLRAATIATTTATTNTNSIPMPMLTEHRAEGHLRRAADRLAVQRRQGDELPQHQHQPGDQHAQRDADPQPHHRALTIGSHRESRHHQDRRRYHQQPA